MEKDLFFSKRTNWALEPNQLISSLEELRRTDSDILDLTESNPTHCGIKYPKKDVLKHLSDEQNLQYKPSPKGRNEAREAICRYYSERGLHVDPQNVFLTSSTSEGYSFLFRLLTNPDDYVIFPRPSYPLFEFLVDLNDVKMDSYPLKYLEKGESTAMVWQIDLAGLEDAIRPRTRSIVLVNPNNPTGSFVKPQELHAINILCQKQNLSIICDEVFYDYPFQDNDKTLKSCVDNKDVLTFVLGGLSKCLGLPQMKLSWIVINGPDELVEEAIGRLEVIADTYLSVNTPSQNSLEHWMTLQPAMRNKIRSRVKKNQAVLAQTFEGVHECQLLNSQGGWYAIMHLPETKTEEEWVLDFLVQGNVFVHPGYFFDFYGEPFIVLSLLTDEAIFETGIKRILARIQETQETASLAKN